MLLLGNYQHALDDKNRIRLPAKFRERLGSEYILFPGTHGCISLYPASAEEKFVNAVNKLGEFSADNAETIRSLTEKAAVVEADSQGRFMLTPDLLRLAHIDKAVRIIGVVDRVEIWSEERYIDRLKGKDESDAAYDELNMKFHNALHEG